MKKIKLLGIDSHNRPVYEDERGQLWKDVTLGSGNPSLYNAYNNAFDGEPDIPIQGDFEIIDDRR